MNSIQRPEGESKFARRFGKVADYGIAAVPILLYRLQGALGLSPQETWFISFVLSYKWDEREPYPSLKEISELSGVPRPTLVRYKNSLVEKGFLRVLERRSPEGGFLSHIYDFTPLFRTMEKLVERIESQGGIGNHQGGGPLADIPMSTSGHPMSTGQPGNAESNGAFLREEDEYKKKNKEEHTCMSAAASSSSSPSLADVETELERYGVEPRARAWLLRTFSPLELHEGVKLLQRMDGLIEDPAAYLFTGFKEGWLLEEVRAKLESKGLFRCRGCGEWTDFLMNGLCSSCYWGRLG